MRFAKIIATSLLTLAAAAGAVGIVADNNASQATAPKNQMMFGVAFYNLENLFDTINNNGKYDL